ncbi:hypothetical protein [Paenibacillus massiliensis]|uniref:hypothetical protein n=1 Tax=Paenibacillus massiliensis TaxID=225917 RepID=UPI00046E6BB0|nr:hypothetical protein [Paenibacillus massiliensis]
MNKHTTKRKNTKQILLAGTMAAALFAGGTIWSAQGAQAATASATSATGNKQAQAQGAQAPEGRGGLGHFGNQGLSTQLQGWLSLDSTTLESKLKDKSLAEIAAEQGVDSAALKTKIATWLENNQSTDRLANVNKTGDTTTKDAAKAPNYTELAGKLLESKGSFKADGPGEGGKGGMFANNTELAALLGLTQDELSKALQSDKSLASIATAQGVDVNKVISLLVSQMSQKTADRPANDTANGSADKSKPAPSADDLKSLVTKLVNGEQPARPDNAAPKTQQ